MTISRRIALGLLGVCVAAGCGTNSGASAAKASQVVPGKYGPPCGGAVPNVSVDGDPVVPGGLITLTHSHASTVAVQFEAGVTLSRVSAYVVPRTADFSAYDEPNRSTSSSEVGDAAASQSAASASILARVPQGMAVVGKTLLIVARVTEPGPSCVGDTYIYAPFDVAVASS